MVVCFWKLIPFRFMLCEHLSFRMIPNDLDVDEASQVKLLRPEHRHRECWRQALVDADEVGDVVERVLLRLWLQKEKTSLVLTADPTAANHPVSPRNLKLHFSHPSPAGLPPYSTISTVQCSPLTPLVIGSTSPAISSSTAHMAAALLLSTMRLQKDK